MWRTYISECINQIHEQLCHMFKSMHDTFASRFEVNEIHEASVLKAQFKKIIKSTRVNPPSNIGFLPVSSGSRFDVSSNVWFCYILYKELKDWYVCGLNGFFSSLSRNRQTFSASLCRELLTEKLASYSENQLYLALKQQGQNKFTSHLILHRLLSYIFFIERCTPDNHKITRVPLLLTQRIIQGLQRSFQELIYGLCRYVKWASLQKQYTQEKRHRQVRER